MKLPKAIERTKRKLIDKAKQGLYENFGQKEVRRLEEKYIDISVYNSVLLN